MRATNHDGTSVPIEAEIERALLELIQAYADEPTPLSL
jgi:hypothetical protein